MTADPDAPEVVVAVPTDIEAATIVAALAARGVEASTTGGYTAGFRAEAPGEVQVIVKQSDLTRARLMLQQIRADNSDIDWSRVDVGQPDDE